MGAKWLVVKKIMNIGNYFLKKSDFFYKKLFKNMEDLPILES